MNTFIRQDAAARRLAKINYDWVAAFFDGDMPLDWSSFLFKDDTDCKNMFEQCSAASLMQMRTEGQSVVLDNMNNDSAFMPFGRYVEYKNLGYKVLPTKIIDSNHFQESIGANSFRNYGRDFILQLATVRNASSFYVHQANLTSADPIVFEFAEEISPTQILLSTHSDYNHTLRGFTVEAYDEEIDQWEMVLEGAWHYDNRLVDTTYDLTPSTAKIFRLTTTHNTYRNALAYTNEIAFIVQDKPIVTETFTPTWCVLVPTRIEEEDWQGKMPLVIAECSGPTGSGELKLDRDSYKGGEKIRILNAKIAVDLWESVV